MRVSFFSFFRVSCFGRGRAGRSALLCFEMVMGMGSKANAYAEQRSLRG
jgi:hypothetical protein